jgi:lipopolysaccharide export system permease protein
VNRLFKKLDILIVKAFIGPFVATFFVTLFVLVLQFFWLYIDDVVGKGIDAWSVIRLMIYLTATLVPLAMPLAMLLSSIMTLGNLGETFELIAIKAAGISLLRFMRPLFFVALALTGVAFMFNNNVLPIATLKMNTLKYDIIVTKPAFDIKEGEFFDRIEGFVIKIGKKEKDDSTIRDVVIYEQNGGTQDNVIIADSGKMVVTPDHQNLVFTLHSGSRYQEKPTGGLYGSQLVRMSFDTYKKVMDLSSFKMNKTDDSTFRNNFQHKTLPELGRDIDSIKKIINGYVTHSAQMVSANMKFSDWLDSTNWARYTKDTSKTPFLISQTIVADSINKAWTKARAARDSMDKANAAASAKTPPPTNPGGGGTPPKSPQPAQPDQSSSHYASQMHGHSTPIAPSNNHIPGGPAANRLAGLPAPPAVKFLDLIPDSAKQQVMEQAFTTINNAKANVDQPVVLYDNEINSLRQHEIAWHEKLTYAIAVLVMFLIGAPLGSIIRKGGIGLPLIFAVVFFVIFWLLNNFGKKFVKEAVMGPVGGMWLATYVLVPIGIFLTYKAMHDSQLFNKEFYFRITRGIRALIQRYRDRRNGRDAGRDTAL